MKKVAFAYTTKIIDFDNYYEAVNYIKNGFEKPWHFEIKHNNHVYNKPWKPFYIDENYEEKYKEYEENLLKYIDQYIEHVKEDKCTYSFKDKEVNEYWTVEVHVPYGKYNCGW